MGCQCCRMIKSYIYDPSALGEPGKGDPSGAGSRGSLYQPRGHTGPGLESNPRAKEGVSNPAYSKSNEGTLKLEADNNHVNLLPVRQQAQQGAAPTGGGALYIIQPQAPGPRWTTEMDRPSLVPVYPDPLEYGGGGVGVSPSPHGYQRSVTVGWDTLGPADDEDEGVGGTPEYPCDTGDEASVLSAEIHTSTTSVSSSDTRDGALRWPATTADTATAESGISGMKSEDEEEEEEEEEQRRRRRAEEEEVGSVTDSMVAEALAAMEAATAGEDFE